ncbi:peptidase M20 [Zhengella mangrovi]|uniref:Peptidase M20 n=1 Tax=Zhengella mangrovi TaxID=1982044 RepID=A0A2G1QSX1_9HYPH|nr:amidohydrolase [Zhengella mangrovi]PHP68595.1 peptidase M20 [Zhengella mangrovi]
MVNPALIDALTDLRRQLHRHPEVSGDESWTAARVEAELAQCAPGTMITGLGGHGVVAVWDSGRPGPSVMIRSELDGLPILDKADVAWRSAIEGRGHLCGHDGHMVILLGLARRLHEHPITRGRAILLFQPAEENGAGAAAMLADPRFSVVKPDMAFALHNLPGMATGAVAVRTGPMCYASEGLSIRLTGRTAHASQPETGLSPAAAMCELVSALPCLPERLGHPASESLVTLVHARLGKEAFGIAPGEAHVMATLRAIDNGKQNALMRTARDLAAEIASRHWLELALETADGFAANVNDAEAVACLERAFTELALETVALDRPFRWSEDFGRFGLACPTAMFVLGAGEDQPPLHAPDYDFPDGIIAPGMAVFERVLRDLCGGD